MADGGKWRCMRWYINNVQTEPRNHCGSLLRGLSYSSNSVVCSGSLPSNQVEQLVHEIVGAKQPVKDKKFPLKSDSRRSF